MSPVTITKEDLTTKSLRAGSLRSLETATNYSRSLGRRRLASKDIARIEMISPARCLEMAAKFRERYLKNSYDLEQIISNLKQEPQAFIVNAGQPNGNSFAFSRNFDVAGNGSL